MKVYEEFLSLSQPHQNKESKLLTSAVPVESKPSKPSAKVWRRQGIFAWVFIHSLCVYHDPISRGQAVGEGNLKDLFNELLFEANVTGLEVWLFFVYVCNILYCNPLFWKLQLHMEEFTFQFPSCKGTFFKQRFKEI